MRAYYAYIERDRKRVRESNSVTEIEGIETERENERDLKTTAMVKYERKYA